MSSSKALSGFTPSRRYGSRPNSTGSNSQYPIASGYASNIFTGDLVRVSAGNLNVIATTTEYVWGVFQGCYYESDGEPKWFMFKHTYMDNVHTHTEGCGVASKTVNPLREVIT